MRPALIQLSVLGLILLVPASVDAQTVAELDAYWAEVTRTVEEGDFEGYSGLYHPDAVLEVGGTVHFDALLVRKDGAWLMMMEYQKQPATGAEWDAVGGTR